MDREASFSHEQRHEANGWRGVRTAPAADAARPAAEDAGSAAARAARLATVATNRRLPPPDPAFRADGVLNEWTNRPALVARELSRVCPEDRRHPPGNVPLWQGPEDFSVRVWWAADGDALCIAAEVIDDCHFNTQTNGAIWNGDALQAGIALATNRHINLGLALTTTGVVFRVFEGPSEPLMQRAAYAVVRDAAARKTRYELRLPLAALGLHPGDVFGFNLAVLDDDDGRGSRYWFQLAPGLCGRNPRTPPPWFLYPRFELDATRTP